MSGQTAGYVDAGPVIAGSLRELATLRPPVPVLSLYPCGEGAAILRL